MSLLFIKIAAFAALGGFLFGYDLGLIGGALLGITEELGLSTFSQEAIVGSAKLGAVFGTFFGGCCMLRYGRRQAIAYSSLFFTLGPLVMAASSSVGGLVVGRIITGFGIGSTAVAIPVYLAEVAPAATRGAVVQVYEVMLCIGMLAAALCDYALRDAAHGWRWMVGIPAIAGAVMGLSPFVLPESPRWLVMRSNFDHALGVLHTVIRAHSPDEVAAVKHMEAAEDELLQLWSSVEKDQAAVLERRAQMMESRRVSRSNVELAVPIISPGTSPRRADKARAAAPEAPSEPLMLQHAGSDVDELVLLPPSRQLLASDGTLSAPSTYHCTRPGEEPTVWHTLGGMLRDMHLVALGPEGRAFWLALGLAVIDQACASTAIINFAPVVLRKLHRVEAGHAVLYSALISASKTVGVLLALCTVDHLGRRPLLIGGSLGCALALLAATPAAAAGSSTLLILMMCLFIFCFSASWAGLYWVVVSEIFSMGAKSPATSAATSLLFLTGAITNFVFLSLIEAMKAYTFLVFSAVSLAGAAYVWRLVPETKGKSLIEIQMELQR